MNLGADLTGGTICVEGMAMRTTVILDDELLNKAMSYTGIKGKTALIREALKVLVQREAARSLARLGGSDPGATLGRRRRLAE